MGSFTLEKIIVIITLGFIMTNTVLFFLNKKLSYNLLCIFIVGYVVDFISNNSILLKVLFLVGLPYLIYLFYEYGGMEKAFNFFKINRSIDDYVWQEINDENGVTLKAGFKNIDTIYYGQVKTVEMNNQNPKIILSNFSTYHFNDVELKNEVLNYPDMANHQVIIDTGKADFIEVYFRDESRKAKV